MCKRLIYFIILLSNVYGYDYLFYNDSELALNPVMNYNEFDIMVDLWQFDNYFDLFWIKLLYKVVKIGEYN